MTIGLLAMVLQEMGVKARSWLGWQIPIHTTDVHSAARITSIETDEIISRFEQGQVAVVAGFRGARQTAGSPRWAEVAPDTSAVALAAALKADRCDIYTDVDGVYTAGSADRSGGEKSWTRSPGNAGTGFLGAKVLQTRSVGLP